MATPAEVIELFVGLRDGSTIARARGAAEVFRAFASLTTDQKRELALLVADRAAPQLVPRIEAETGLELSREQIQAVIDMAGRLDDEDLDELVHTVRDREARGEALRTVATAAATAGGLDDVVTPESPEVTEPADVTVPAPETAPAPASPPPEPAHVTVPAEVETDAELVELDHEPEPTVEVEPAPEPREFTSIFATLPDVPAWEPSRDGAGEPAVTAARVQTLPGHVHDGPDLSTRVRAARRPLVERLRAATSDGARLRLLRQHLDDVAAFDAPGRAAVVGAVPDGWARRRALEALMAAGAVPADEVTGLVRRVGRPMARAWVVASAIEAGLLSLDDVDTLVDERAAGRLQRRYG